MHRGIASFRRLGLAHSLVALRKRLGSFCESVLAYLDTSSGACESTQYVTARGGPAGGPGPWQMTILLARLLV